MNQDELNQAIEQLIAAIGNPDLRAAVAEMHKLRRQKRDAVSAIHEAAESCGVDADEVASYAGRIGALVRKFKRSQAQRAVAPSAYAQRLYAGQGARPAR